MDQAIKRGTELSLNIESLAFGGRGVARLNGLVVFVEEALPGQQVKARIFRKRKGYAEARTLLVLRESPERVEPRCPHFGECGGCHFQTLNYAAQLQHKRRQVVESLEHLGGFENPPVLETLPSPDQYYYRNKMEYSFGRQRWVTKSEIGQDYLTKPKSFALGLHVRGRFDKILDLDTCYLQSPVSAEILNFVRQFVLQSEIPPYTTRDHSGFWRHLVVREGKNTGDLLINIVTAEVTEFYKQVDALATHLRDAFPRLTTMVHNINRKKAEVATGDEERVLYGNGTIREKIGHRLFQISANSFFQTNTKGAEILYDKVLEYANFKNDDTVFDLYSGAGTISLYIADKVQKVIGFEVVEHAVKDAQVNCQLNGVENGFFVQGDLKESLTLGAKGSNAWGRPRVIVIDPPRAGMHAEVLNQVLRLRAERIVYVSCNPTTFARDAKELCNSGYDLKKVQPVDMFPHTAHIELVSLLGRRNDNSTPPMTC